MAAVLAIQDLATCTAVSGPGSTCGQALGRCKYAMASTGVCGRPQVQSTEEGARLTDELKRARG